MATWQDVARLVDALPLTEQPSPRYWRVGRKPLVWERPWLHSERELDDGGDVLAVRVPDEATKAALLAGRPAVYATTPHFDGYPVVLVRLAGIGVTDLAELIAEAWRAQAPRTVVREYLARRA